MKGAGETIGGYRLVSEPTNDGGGKCMWAFGEKDGRQYFIKRFLDPKRPKETSSASAISKKLRLQECAEFEDRHRSIMERLRHDESGGGNLVLAVDFFHEGATYYKVTERIEVSSLDRPERLGAREKTVLLRTLAFSLRQLHHIDVVHGDLKPANVLVQKKAGSPFHLAKLIDFDDSYISGRPPSRDTIGGDSLFGAPEWRRYLQGDEEVAPEFLTTAVDMFALGLMTHFYLTGSLPGYDDRFGSPADAVNAGDGLRLDDRLTPGMRRIVLDLTARAPGARPGIAAFIDLLKDPDVCALTGTGRPVVTDEPVTVPTTRTSRLKTNLNGSAPPSGAGSGARLETPPDTRSPAERSISRVRINLTDRDK